MKHANTTCAELRASRTCYHLLPPKLLLIGMPHAGTTTLSSILNAHPNVSYGWTFFYLLLASASEAILRDFSACTLSSRAEAALRSGDVSHFAHL